MVLGNTLNILRPPDRSTPMIQTGWNEDLVKNMHNVLGELAQQITAQTFGGFPEGTARPAIVKANGLWLDITSATVPILKLFDGTDDITVMTFNYAANTVTFAGVSFDLVDDTSPQLGGDLDLNGNVITGLEIGTDVQALDATLTSLAAVAGVAGDIFYASNTDVWTRLAKGSDDEVLTLASGIPSWAVPAGGGGGLVAYTVFTGNGTWTPSSSASTALIRCTAGGGGGTTAAGTDGGAGGGAGSTAITFVPDTTAVSTPTVTIGNGGGTGSDGGDSSVGALAVAGKGKGASGSAGGDGGVATTGDMLIGGGGGADGAGTLNSSGGDGGGSFWGGGGGAGKGASITYGGGGGGDNAGTGAGAGKSGVAEIMEW